MSLNRAPRTRDADCKLRIELHGRVQGIGYRPALARLAVSLNLSGTVANTTAGILIEIAGDIVAAEEFLSRCAQVCPAEGVVEGRRVEPSSADISPGFRIIDGPMSGPLSTPVPLDRVVCSECLHEFRSTSDRRFAYPLISCSRCGPRYSILANMPYERHQTAMHGYSFCERCQGEYQSPNDRRFHAQVIGCHDCGPQVEGLNAAIAALHANQVVALKGVGGYQFLTRAASSIAIAQLRRIKQRPAKPFAIMVEDLEQASLFGQVDEVAIGKLTSWAGPIVIVPQWSDGRQPTDILNPGLHSIGLMLPTTALHAFLVQTVGPLVVTSANIEGDPLYYRDADWPSELQQSMPTIVTHDRAIYRPIDDSVVRVMAGQATTIRAARGMAPMWLELGALAQGKQVLAVGGEQKVAVALCNGQQAILGPHLGDMNSAAARQYFSEQVPQLLQLYGCRPTVIVHDAHPDFFTTRWAQQFSRDEAIPAIRIQHHVAHAASSLIEPGWLQGDAAIVTWDGSGLGEDGTIWGGEGFLYRRSTYQRVCRLQPFLLPGGEAAIRQPWRVAAGMLHSLRMSNASFTFEIPQPQPLELLLDAPRIHCPTTSSMGRLFDAAAVLIMGDLLPGWTVDYEGQFAALLEAHADGSDKIAYQLPLNVTRTAKDNRSCDDIDEPVAMEWNWKSLVRQIVVDRVQGVASPVMAMRFHRALAVAIATFAQATGRNRLSLSGGVFQNQLLVELLVDQLHESPIQVTLPASIPVNDGGLAAGQLVAALQYLHQG